MGFLSKIFEYKHFSKLFLLSGIIFQTICCLLVNDPWISYVCALSGIICVILCAQKKMSQFIFSFIQLFTYSYISYKAKLYGEVLVQAFYLVTMIFGIFVWKKHLADNKTEIISKELNHKEVTVTSILGIISCIILYRMLLLTDDPQVFMDSVTTVTAFIAQILMMCRFRDNWIWWLMLDIASIYMWAIAGNWLLVIQFILWSINCLYGYYNWKPENNT